MNILICQFIRRYFCSCIKKYVFNQCWGSGSGCFLGLPDHDLLVRDTDPDPDPSLFSKVLSD